MGEETRGQGAMVGIAPSKERIEMNAKRAFVETGMDISKTISSANIVDQLAQAVLEDLPEGEMDGIQMLLENLSDTDLNPDRFFSDHPLYFTYCGYTDTDVPEPYYYMLFLSVRANKEAATLVSSSLIRLTPQGDFCRYNFKTMKWDWSENGQTIHNLIQKNGPESELLGEMERTANTSIFLMDEAFVTNTVRENEKLIALYKTLDGLAKYEIVMVNGQDMVVLVPDDPKRRGSAVGYDDGMFIVYQYMDGYDMMDAADAEDGMFVMDLDYGATPYEFVYLQPVVKTENVKDVLEIVYQMWDHYSKHDTVFALPLSSHAYTDSAQPFQNLKTHTRNGNTLTDEEKENYNAVKDLFDPQWLSYPG